uniref:Uncharacterized protein n=1 Tax=Arundo donax TaxID=35708 RepID=A0A0A9HD68_ARUDO
MLPQNSEVPHTKVYKVQKFRISHLASVNPNLFGFPFVKRKYIFVFPSEES